MHKMKKKIWKRALSVMLAAALLMTAVPVDVNAGNKAAEAAGGAVSQNTAVPPETYSYTAEAATGNIFDNTTITLDELILKATYKDKDGKTVVETLEQDGTFQLPYDADINMKLNFKLGNALALEDGKTYVYKLPDSISVNMENVTHQLLDNSGVSIGQVHIAPDGTLSFVFHKDVIGGNTNVNFFVQLEGGLASDLQQAGKEEMIQFPTASGDFNITVNTTEKNEQTPPQPGDIGIFKGGSRVINVDGKNYIEWTVELAPNGRDSLNGVIVDELPQGLTYAAVAGYPKADEISAGAVTTVAKDGDTRVEINLTDIKTFYHAKVKFCTYYDTAAFGASINNNTNQTIDNTAIFNPSDEDKGVLDTGTVTIKPELLEKSGAPIDAAGKITWTVVLNKEKLNLQGTTYKDTIGSGQTLDFDSVKLTPNAGVLNQTEGGFEITFSDAKEMKETITITYETTVTDFGQSNYQNKAELTGGKDVTIDVSKDASVPGYKLFDKKVKNFNSVTNTFTWEITVNESGIEMENVVVTDCFAAGDRSNAGGGG